MVKIVETNTKAAAKRNKIQQQQHPITKKKLKQMTLLDTFVKTPRVLVSPLRLPLDVLKQNSLPQPGLQLSNININDNTMKNENKSLINESTIAISKKRIQICYPKPEPKLVCLPNGLKNSNFGDALFICQFLGDFRKALEIPSTFEISTDYLIKAVSLGLEGFDYINTLLVIFLTAISEDMEKVVELGIKLNKITVTNFSAPEIARLFLIKAHSIKSNNEMQVLLTTKEFYELEPSTIMEALSRLCEMAVECRVVGLYSEQILEERAKFYRQRPSILILEKELNAIKLKQLQETDRSKIADQDSTILQESVLENSALSTSSFYGDSSRISRSLRQITAEKLRLEKTQAELERQKRFKEEKEIAKMESTINKFTTDLKVVCNDVKHMLRLNPIGVDKEDNRYWWFNHNSLNLVVEKEWQFNENNSSSKWFTYDSNQYSKLRKALDIHIDNERFLKNALKLNIAERSKLEVKKSTNELILTTDWNEKLLETLKEDVKNLLNSVIDDLLGWMSDFEIWRKRLSKAEKLFQMRDLLLDIYKCMHGSCVRKISKRFPLENWVTEVKKCQNFTRMLFLVAVLDAYVTSNKDEGLEGQSSAESSASDNESSENDEVKDENPLLHSKCSRCKRHGGALFGCIKCPVAFHLNCYKPQLRYPPRAFTCEICKQRKAPLETLSVNKLPKSKTTVKQSKVNGLRRSQRFRDN